MKIKFLGTGGVSGVPEWNCDCEVCKSNDPKDKRLRPVLFVQIEEKNIIIDFGPDFRQQLLKNEIKKLDFAFLTHAHGDHMNGYMELARQKNLVFEAPRKVLDEFFRRIRSSKDWLLRRNPTMQMNYFKKKKIGQFEIDTVALKHQKDYEEEYMPCYGYIFRSSEFSFAYLSDYNEIIEIEKLKNLDLFISEGNGLDKSNTGHAGVNGSIEVYKKIKPKRMILTHINHKTGHAFLTEHVSKFGNIEIAYDGMEINTE
ncbi:MBL fold metallo-hydrolase [Candidatus Woesearchaeota archaeon]|nr:MBL fold metallo-hydrolase [Candidatus Woesearchaeota archaeon]